MGKIIFIIVAIIFGVGMLALFPFLTIGVVIGIICWMREKYLAAIGIALLGIIAQAFHNAFRDMSSK